MYNAEDNPAYKTSIVRIYQGNRIIGTGFYLKQGYLLTCAHVVRDSLNLSGSLDSISISSIREASIKLQFNCLCPGCPPQSAVVIADSWRMNNEDVVLLKLTAAPPANLASSPITPSPNTYQAHEFQVYGYAKSDGGWADGTFLGSNDTGRVEMHGLDGRPVRLQRGFSGSPVWDKSLGTIVGMTVATLVEEDHELSTNDETKIGYMIPYRRLQSSLQEIDVHILSSSIEPYLPSIAVLLDAAYEYYHPQLETYPIDLKSKLRGVIRCDKLPEFLACLLLDTLPSGLDRALRDWFARTQLDPDVYLALARDHFQTPHATEQRQSHLLFWVQPESGKYSVQALLIKDASQYNAHASFGCTPLDAPGDFAEVVDYKELSPILIACLQECSHHGIVTNEQLRIEIFLPHTLLNKAVESWPLDNPPEDDFFNPFRVCDTIGLTSQVVIRASDRLRPQWDRLRREYWEPQWSTYQQLQDRPGPQCLEPGDHLDKDQLVGRLTASTRVGLYLSAPPADTPSMNDLCAVLFNRVAPIVVLWPRYNPKEINTAQSVEDLISPPLYQLPFAIHQSRINAFGHNNLDAYLGHHLSLLWDNPHLIPPSVAQRDPSPTPSPTAIS